MNNVIVSPHYLSTELGSTIFNKGGNAVDSAIAMALVLPICEPQSTGYFGDVFCIISQSDDTQFIGLNGSGRSPSLLNSEILKLSPLNCA